MFKKLAGLIATAVVALSVGVATPAQAVGSCPSGWICFFDTGVSANYMEARDYSDSSSGECHAMPSSANNRTSYIVNRASGGWKTYNASNCTGTAGTIYANSSGTMNAANNNNISSYKRG